MSSDRWICSKKELLGAGRKAIEISGSRFDYDAERLIRVVQTHTDGARDPRSRPAKQRRWWPWVSDPKHQRVLSFIGAGIAAAAIGGWTVAAEPLFTKALEQNKAQAAAGNEKAADAAFQLGELAHQRLDYARAYEHYLEAAKIEPDNPT